MIKNPTPNPCRCSFCGTNEIKTRLVAGPGVFICWRCALDAAATLLVEYDQTRTKETDQ